ncbi:MAG: 30S ribosomal protein S6 [Candidatus Saccharibacteria bacterium]|nr:30S ribosomal protein S6 [Candidatus Saccharibacteria bacterium]MDO4967547.1 30S ribosomal protein S6 [Candidatus Saccharibacteria bacterium]
MKQYELTVMFHPDLEMNMTPALDKVQKIIEDNGGKITKDSNEGKKRLAYSIAKNEYAIYYYYDLELPAQAPQKISSTLNITDEVIRYLLVAVDPRKAKYAAKKESTESEDAESKESEE